ncbi:hypothetical protein HPP92_022417 [Vanilla planifolia]|uniref:Uncharacterized protein n=1 Tax=Vanilla planifolia TaxID=51239 RepID=A0A835PT89_VANPL|nr:hypothetical protein HPP92_022417 [Vanilla planifolia]
MSAGEGGVREVRGVEAAICSRTQTSVASEMTASMSEASGDEKWEKYGEAMIVGSGLELYGVECH